MSYKFQYTLDDADFFECNKYSFDNIKGKKELMRNYQYIVPIVGFLILVFVLISSRGDFYIRGVLTIAIALIIISAVWFFAVRLYFNSFFKSDSRVKKLIDTAKEKGQSLGDKNYLVQLDNEYFYSHSDSGEFKFKISVFQRIAEGNNAIYLYSSLGRGGQPVHGYIIPNSVFDSEEHKRGFVDFVKAKTTSVIS